MSGRCVYSERGEAWAWARTNDSVGLVECVHANNAPASAFALAPNLQAGIHDTSTAAEELLEFCLRCAPWQLRRGEQPIVNTWLVAARPTAHAHKSGLTLPTNRLTVPSRLSALVAAAAGAGTALVAAGAGAGAVAPCLRPADALLTLARPGVAEALATWPRG